MLPERIGRYEIKSELGRGGMATVYLAHDPHIRRDVAVKVLPPQFLHDPTFRTRFVREAQIVASLEHPAIVPIYDYGEHEGQPYLVMRYMPGGTLADRLAEQGPMTLPKVVTIVERIAGALERAHGQDVIHRDLKPGNILFDQFGEAYLADFGIVKVAAEGSSALTGSGVIGTPAYMSPELARGERLDGRSDVYALGTMVFEMLTGQTPYQADTPMGLAVKHITEPVPSIRAMKGDLPAGTDTLIQQSMAKERVHRYPTASDFAHALRNLTHHAPRTTHHAPNTSQQPTTNRGRLPLVMGFMILLCLASLIGGGFVVRGLLNGAENDSPTRPAIITTTLTPSPPQQVATEDTSGAAPTVTVASSQPTGDIITVDNLSQLGEIARLGNGSVQTVAFSPDGSQFLVAGGLGVWLYDSETLAELAWLDGHIRTVRSAAWSPDGTFIASGSDDGLLVVWEVATGRVIDQWQAHNSWIHSLTWSPDGTQLASGSDDRTAKVWPIATSDEPVVFNSHTDWVRTVAWSPDGAQLASGDTDGNIFIWDSAGEVIESWSQPTGVNDLAWSPNGTQLVTGGGDRIVRVWQADGELVQEALRHGGEVWAVVWNPAGDEIASSSLDGTVAIMDATTLATTQSFDNFVGGVPALSWQGDQLLIASEDGLVQLRNAETGTLQNTLTAHSAPINTVAWSPDSQQIAIGTEGLGVQIWDSASGEKVQDLVGHTSGLRGVAWSPDGTRLVSGDFVGIVRVWDVATGRELLQVRHGNVVEGVAWSPDGRWIASSGRGEGVRIWDIATGENLFNLSHNGATVEQASWSSDGHWLATAASDNLVYLWDGQTGEPITTLPHSASVGTLAWSPDDSQLATGTTNGTIQVWAGGTWQPTATLSDHVGAVRHLAWSPDGQMLVSVGSDRIGRVWDVPAGSLLTPLANHRFTIWGVAWSPDGRYIATASGDGVTRIFGTTE